MAVTFAASGRPVLSYAQRTWRAGTDEPLHSESGWLRGQLEGRAELVVAGCAILETILDLWPATKLGVADRGIREGLLHELMAENKRQRASA